MARKCFDTLPSFHEEEQEGSKEQFRKRKEERESEAMNTRDARARCLLACLLLLAQNSLKNEES